MKRRKGRDLKTENSVIKKATLGEKIEERSTNINLVRFLAAIGVLVSHAHILADGSEDLLYRLTGVTWGSLAVCFFFFVSGLYVTKSLTVKKLSGRKYIFSRIKRIIPPLAVVILASVFFLGPCMSTLGSGAYFGNINTWKYLLNICLIPVHNLPGVFERGNLLSTVNGSLWTLPVEFLCYVFLYVLYKMKFLKKEKNIIFGAGLLISCVVFYWIGCKVSSSVILSAAQAVVLFFMGGWYYLNKEKMIFDIRFGLAAAIGWFLFSWIKLSFWGNILFLPVIIVTFLIGTKQILHQGSKIGNLSYVMYLTAFPVQQTVISLNGGAMSPYLNIVFSIPIVLILAYVVCWVEKKMIRLVNW